MEQTLHEVTHPKMATAMGTTDESLQRREIILFWHKINSGALFKLFKEKESIPAKTLRRKLGRRNYENFRDQILIVNSYLVEKDILEPFKIYWTTENGREHKAIHKKENVLLETRNNSLFITMKA